MAQGFHLGMFGAVWAVMAASSCGAFQGATNRPAPQWPQWRGAGRDNRSRETGLLPTWPEGGPRRVWTVTGIGKGFCAPAIADGKLFTAGTTDQHQTWVWALNLDGTVNWRTPNGAPWTPKPGMMWVKSYSGARATPTVDDGVVYHMNEVGRLAAFDAGNGREIWGVELTETFEAPCPKWGYSESVLIDGDRLICYPGGQRGYMVALDKKTGATIWANREIGVPAAYASAILVEDRGARQLVTLNEGHVVGVDADTGKLLWTVEHAGKRKNLIPTPIYHDGMIFASCGYGGGTIAVRLSFDGKRVGAEVVWKHDGLDNVHGGLVLLDGYLYGSSHEKEYWYCLDAKTGQETYRERAFGKGSLTYADGMFYCLGEKGTMALVKATPRAFEMVSRFEVPKGGGGLFWTHPVVLGGRLYLRHADRLDAYDIQGP